MIKSAIGAMCLSAFAIALTFGPRAGVAEDIPAALAENGNDEWIRNFPLEGAPDAQIAQFQVPARSPGAKKSRRRKLPSVLQFSYVAGAEFEAIYNSNLDLQDGLEDKQLLGAPTMFGSATYRPTGWAEFMVEGTLEKLVGLREEEFTTLPDGSQVGRDKKPWSLLIDQIFGKFTIPSQPIDVTIGRRAFLDQRLWVYDVEMDGIVVTVRPRPWTFELSATRLEALDLDLLDSPPKAFTNTYMFTTEYRGFEDHNLLGYALLRDHNPSAGEGRPQFYGLSAVARPSNALTWWALANYVDGRDESEVGLKAYAFQAGGTYRFIDTFWQPTITLDFAFGTGDGDSTDGTNNQHRQTGLNSNEGRFGGVTQFLYYGEALDPELSNIKIFTAGASVRPAAGFFIDVVYHHYRLHHVATSIRGSAITAELNGITGQESKNIGNEVDIAVGFRNILGVRALGAEARLGMFFPGPAFDRTENGVQKKGDMALTGLGVVFISF